MLGYCNLRMYMECILAWFLSLSSTTSCCPTKMCATTRHRPVYTYVSANTSALGHFNVASCRGQDDCLLLRNCYDLLRNCYDLLRNRYDLLCCVIHCYYSCWDAEEYWVVLIILGSNNQLSCGWVGLLHTLLKNYCLPLLGCCRKIFGYYLRSIRLRLVCHLCYAKEVLFAIARMLWRDIWVVLSVN